MESETKPKPATVHDHLKEARDVWNSENPATTTAHTFGVIDEGKLYIRTREGGSRGREVNLDELLDAGYSVEVFSISKWSTHVKIRKGRK